MPPGPLADRTGPIGDLARVVAILEDAIFTDGLESGDTSVWGSSSPLQLLLSRLPIPFSYS